MYKSTLSTNKPYTVKKTSDFSVPSRDVTNQTLFVLVSDIPAGDGKIANLFYSVVISEHG
jgi:hypothetical protein